jgi:hypothetical protein
VLRKSATDARITRDIKSVRATDYLQVFIACGSPAVKPKWQASGDMTEQDADHMARYIQ